jgi:hypothetical protein
MCHFFKLADKPLAILQVFVHSHPGCNSLVLAGRLLCQYDDYQIKQTPPVRNFFN